MTKTYPQELVDNAARYGFKAANLMFMKDKIREFNSGFISNIQLRTPEFVPLSNTIINHLNNHALNWKKYWDEFVEIYKLQEVKDVLSKESIEKLEILHRLIRDCFANHIFENEKINELLSSLPEDSFVTERSTGGNEDKVDMANPGGNETVISSKKEISKSLGIVIASYIDEKSLSQRLKAGDDITEFPLKPRTCSGDDRSEWRSNIRCYVFER